MTDVLLRSELLARLGNRTRLAVALRDGSWQRVLRGTYVPGSVEVDLAVRAAAAQLLLPAGAHVADRCLLWLLGIDVLPPGPRVLECVVPGGVVVRRQGVRARQAELAPGDRMLLGGSLRVLRPARAVLDLARTLPLVEAVVAVDATQHAGLCSAADLLAELPRHAGRRGARQARRVLGLASPLAESPQESRLRCLLVLGGLDPVAQHVVRTPGGAFLARVDLAFPHARVVVEFDGREVHLRSDAFVRERRRQNALLSAGWLVLRYTADDLRCRPQAVLTEVTAAVRTRAA